MRCPQHKQHNFHHHADWIILHRPNICTRDSFSCQKKYPFATESFLYPLLKLQTSFLFSKMSVCLATGRRLRTFPRSRHEFSIRLGRFFDVLVCQPHSNESTMLIWILIWFFLEWNRRRIGERAYFFFCPPLGGSCIRRLNCKSMLTNCKSKCIPYS